MSTIRDSYPFSFIESNIHFWWEKAFSFFSSSNRHIRSVKHASNTGLNCSCYRSISIVTTTIIIVTNAIPDIPHSLTPPLSLSHSPSLIFMRHCPRHFLLIAYTASCRCTTHLDRRATFNPLSLTRALRSSYLFQQFSPRLIYDKYERGPPTSFFFTRLS